MKENSPKFKRGDLFKLFLIVAFPLHAWTIIMALRDVGWVAESRTIGGAVGFSAYVFLYTLAESLLLWGFILLLGLLISRVWSKDQRLMSLGLIAMILSAWSILEQILLVLYFDKMVHVLSRFPLLSASPWISLLILGVVITVSFALPVFLVLRSIAFTEKLNALFDRLTLLSGMYLLFDAAALVIVIVRNV